MMRVLPGMLLGACFALGMVLIALFVVLLRSALLHLVKSRGGKPILEIEPDVGIDQEEQIKRPAFLSGIQDLAI
jgi:hypothetical protein